MVQVRIYDHNGDINPRNQRALTLPGFLFECSLILFTLGQNPNLSWSTDLGVMGLGFSVMGLGLY